MKLSQNGALVIAAMCLAPCAHAGQPGTAYAAVKAIIDYCGRVDEHHRSDYVSYGARALASVNGGKSSDYQAVYDATTIALRKISDDVGRSQCAEGIGLNAFPSKERP